MTNIDKTDRDVRCYKVSPDTLYALRNGDEEAYIVVYNCFADSLKRFLVYLTGSVDQGEELLQEVFIKVWETRSVIDPDKNFKSYLFSISRNMALNHLRTLRHYERLDESCDIDAGDYYVADQAMIARDTELLVEIAVESMPRQRREVFRMYQKGMTYDEIASKLGITTANARKYVMRARNDIKDMLAIIAFFLLTS